MSIDGGPRPGYVLAGRYRLRSPVGAGDMGMVWSAADQVLGRTVAVKHLVGDHGREHLMREARMAAVVVHPRLLRVYDVISEAGDAWMIVQFVDARTWSTLWLQHGRVAPRAAANVAAQVADALAAMHGAGLVHGDVTPDNVLVDADGEVKLVDFGAARLLGEDVHPGSRITGARDYRAPEVRAGADPGPPADLYALGAAVSEAVYGNPTGPGAAGPLDDVLVRLLAADVGCRPDAVTARDLFAEVAAGVGAPGTSRPGG